MNPAHTFSPTWGGASELIDSPHLVYVSTVATSLRTFLAPHVRFLKAHGFKVSAVCAPADHLDELSAQLGIQIHSVPMARRVTPAADAITLLRLVRLFGRIRPDIVHAHTPKGGLLGTLAARIAGVPVRIYTIHGLVHLARSGWMKRLLRSTERLSCRWSHRVLCVSPSIRAVAISEDICPADKIGVIAHGSICGVDTKRFDRTEAVMARAAALRRQWSLSENGAIVGFLGRLTRDKGVEELAAAWARIADECPTAHLLLVGEFEPQDPPSSAAERILRDHPHVHLTGWQDDVVPYLALMGFVVLPTYREGFGLTLIEAAAMGIPSIATDIPGCVDAVEDGVTGVLVEPANAEALADAMRQLLLDPDLCARLGAAGRRRVERLFRPEDILRGHLDEYNRLLDRGK